MTECALHIFITTVTTTTTTTTTVVVVCRWYPSLS